MWSLLWLWCCLLAPVALSRALELSDLFQFGAGAGDARLQPGSDSTAELSLHTSVFYFGAKFDKVYVSFQDFCKNMFVNLFEFFFSVRLFSQMTVLGKKKKHNLAKVMNPAKKTVLFIVSVM